MSTQSMRSSSITPFNRSSSALFSDLDDSSEELGLEEAHTLRKAQAHFSSSAPHLLHSGSNSPSSPVSPDTPPVSLQDANVSPPEILPGALRTVPRHRRQTFGIALLRLVRS